MSHNDRLQRVETPSNARKLALSQMMYLIEKNPISKTGFEVEQSNSTGSTSSRAKARDPAMNESVKYLSYPGYKLDTVVKPRYDGDDDAEELMRQSRWSGSMLENNNAMGFHSEHYSEELTKTTTIDLSSLNVHKASVQVATHSFNQKRILPTLSKNTARSLAISKTLFISTNNPTSKLNLEFNLNPIFTQTINLQKNGFFTAEKLADNIDYSSMFIKAENGEYLFVAHEGSMMFGKFVKTNADHYFAGNENQKTLKLVRQNIHVAGFHSHVVTSMAATHSISQPNCHSRAGGNPFFRVSRTAGYHISQADCHPRVGDLFFHVSRAADYHISQTNCHPRAGGDPFFHILEQSLRMRKHGSPPARG